MSERVCKLATEKHDFELWDAYVDNHSEGSFFHLSGWRDVICEVYKHTPYYLILETREPKTTIPIQKKIHPKKEKKS